MIASTNSDEELAVGPGNDHGPGQPTAPSKPCLTRFRLFSGLLAVGAVIAIALSAGVFPSSEEVDTSDFDIFDPSTWIPRWLDDNPHGGDTPYDFNTWDTQRMCNGLELHIIDSLDEKWAPYFEQSIKDWENGDPDVLTLHVRKALYPDPVCEPSEKVMKVCNGDYGKTDWIGVNHIVIHYKHIISSVAMMNDYYLDEMGDAAKRNTMCHELGHGFGLGHWDEDFYNRDLGNCMDYTKKHENNQAPDHTNFVFLEQMYGNVDGSSLYVEASNGVEGLHCASVSSDYSKIFHKNEPAEDAESEIFKTRKLTEDVGGLSPEEFAHYASLLSDVGNVKLGERKLRTAKKEIREQSFENGVKIVSIIHRP